MNMGDYIGEIQVKATNKKGDPLK